MKVDGVKSGKDQQTENCEFNHGTSLIILYPIISLLALTIGVLILLAASNELRAGEQASNKRFNFNQQIEQLKKAKKVAVYLGLSGPIGGSDSPYANNRELNRANPNNEAELKAWSCAYQIENTQAISDLTTVLLTKTDWTQALHHRVLPVTMKYTKKNGVMEYEKFLGGHVVIDFIFPDETQTRFSLGNNGDVMGFIEAPHSNSEVNTYGFYNSKHGHSLGTRFFEWLRLEGGKPSVGDVQRLSVEDCEFWQRRAVYRSWDGN